jgi:hypothetical protein
MQVAYFQLAVIAVAEPVVVVLAQVRLQLAV